MGCFESESFSPRKRKTTPRQRAESAEHGNHTNERKRKAIVTSAQYVTPYSDPGKSKTPRCTLSPDPVQTKHKSVGLKKKIPLSSPAAPRLLMAHKKPLNACKFLFLVGSDSTIHREQCLASYWFVSDIIKSEPLISILASWELFRQKTTRRFCQVQAAAVINETTLSATSW